MKDEMMQNTEQSEKNDAGDPTAHLGAPKGTKEAEMAKILIFLFSWINLWQIVSVAL